MLLNHILIENSLEASIAVALVSLGLGPGRLHNTGLCLVLGLHDSTVYQQSAQGHGREVVFASQFLETDNPVDSNAVHEHDNGREGLNRQLLDEEWALFGVHLDKARFDVHGRNLFQMHVDYLASFEIAVVKVTHNVLTLGDHGEEFFLNDLLVLSMSDNFLLLLLCEVSLHIVQSHLLDLALHFFFIAVGGKIVVRILVFLIKFSQRVIRVLHLLGISCCIGLLHFFLDNLSLVFDGFL